MEEICYEENVNLKFRARVIHPYARIHVCGGEMWDSERPTTLSNQGHISPALVHIAFYPLGSLCNLILNHIPPPLVASPSISSNLPLTSKIILTYYIVCVSLCEACTYTDAYLCTYVRH